MPISFNRIRGVPWRHEPPRPPVFGTCRTYRGNLFAEIRRIVYGTLILSRRSRARGLHTLYEYGKGYFRSWLDRCGVDRTALARWHFGLPRTVTVTDFGTIHHVSHFDFYRDKTLKRVSGPDGASAQYSYDGKKRLVRESMNGLGSQFTQVVLNDHCADINNRK